MSRLEESKFSVVNLFLGFTAVFVFHLCMAWPSSAFAATPTIVSVSPSSGTALPNTPVEFNCSYSDASGWNHLNETYLLISPAATTCSNAVYLYYNQNTNLFYLKNDANTSWLGGYAPGSSNVIENSQVKLDCALSTATGSGNTLAVKFSISFKNGYSGKTYNSYLYAKDDTGKYVGWTKKGAYTVNQCPGLGTVAPSAGTGAAGAAQIFTAVYSDSDGWQNLMTVNLLINTIANGGYCFSAYYNQNTNKLYLWNDSGTAVLGGYAPGSGYVIENSFGRLDCSQTKVSGSGSTMTVSWRVTLKPSFTGTRNIYLLATDDTNITTPIVQKGIWTIPNNMPSVGTVAPSSGIGQVDTYQSFKVTYADPDGYQNLWCVNLFFNPTGTSAANCFFGSYNQITNQLFLLDNAGANWLGGYRPGSNYVVENSYARLNCSKTTVSKSANTITISWAVSFKPTFTGSKNIYIRSTDYANATTNFLQKGTWTINNSPSVGTVSPSSGTGTVGITQVFTAAYSDPDGWQNLYAVNLVVNINTAGSYGYSAYYDQNADKLYMRDDTGTIWQGGYAPGSSYIIENTYARLDCSKTTVSGSGNTLTVNWAVSFKPSFTGTKNIYLAATDDTLINTGIIQKGAWTIQPDITRPQVIITQPQAGAIFTD